MLSISSRVNLAPSPVAVRGIASKISTSYVVPQVLGVIQIWKINCGCPGFYHIISRSKTPSSVLGTFTTNSTPVDLHALRGEEWNPHFWKLCQILLWWWNYYHWYLLLLLGRSPCPHSVLIVGWGCSSPQTEATGTLKSVPIWLLVLC